MTADGGSETRTEGAIKVGSGKYFFNPEDERSVDAGPGYSTANGAVLEGERHQAGLMQMKAGTGAEPHSHPNEQFIFVVQGKARFRVGDEEATLSEGSIAYIPPNTVHETKVLSDEDVYFFTSKDLSHGIAGDPVDEESTLS